MKCPNCKQQLPSKAKFCDRCGASIPRHKALLWVLTVLMGLSGLTYITHPTGWLMLIFAAICAPAAKIQSFWRSKGLRGPVKGALLVAIFLLAGALMPSNVVDRTAPPDKPVAGQQENSSGRSELALPSANEAGGAGHAPSQDDVQPPAGQDSADTQPPEDPPAAQQPEGPTTQQPENPSDQQTEDNNTTPSGSENGNGDNFNTHDNPDQQGTSYNWVLNTSSMKIHYPSCSAVKKIAPQNYATSNLSESELMNRGYTKCGICH